MISYTDNEISSIKKYLKNTTNKNHYNNWNNRTYYGYSSFNIGNINIIGQRQPLLRLNKIKQFVDFNDKILIDFGCNCGGMIFHIPELKQAIGFDFDKNCIESCNHISSILKLKTLHTFNHQDLNNFDLQTYMTNNNIVSVDIILLLSLGSWIRNWRSLYNDAYQYSKQIILETNNDMEGEPQLELFISLGANIKLISDKSDDDTTGNIGRKTYLISH